MPSKASLPHIDDLAALYLSGDSIKGLSERFGACRSRVTRLLRDAGIPLRTHQEAQQLSADRMSPETRKRMVGPAHDAVRGKRQSDEHRCKIAATRERECIGTSRTEELFAGLLEQTGWTVTPQKALGRYNVDMALDASPVTVDIFGGYWHVSGRAALRFKDRTEYLLDAGYTPIYVWVSLAYPIEPGGIEYVVALAELARLDETPRREYHMIYGNGQLAAIGEGKLYDRASIPARYSPQDTLREYLSSL